MSRDASNASDDPPAGPAVSACYGAAEDAVTELTLRVPRGR